MQIGDKLMLEPTVFGCIFKIAAARSAGRSNYENDSNFEF